MFIIDTTFSTLRDFYLGASMIGIMILLAVFLLLALLLRRGVRSKIMIAFEMLFEKIYYFYSDILGEKASKQIKTYVTVLFFVIFIANIVSVIFDFIAPVF